MNLSKFKFGFEKHGPVGFINILLSKIGFKYRIDSELKRMIVWHGKNIARICARIKLSVVSTRVQKLKLIKIGIQLMQHLNILVYMN